MVSASVPMSTIMPSWNPSVGWGAHTGFPSSIVPCNYTAALEDTHTHTSLNTDLAGSMQILSNKKVIVLFNANHVTVNKMQVEADKVISSTDDGNENNKTTCYISHFKVLICIMYKCTLKLDLWRQYEWSFLMQISKPQCYSGCKRIVSMLWEVARSFLGWYGCNGIVKPSFHDFRHLYTILRFGP